MPRGVDRYDEARLQRRLWTPEHLRGKLFAWYDAQSIDTIVRTTTVSQWKDKSGRGWDLTTAVAEPGFSETAFRGRLPGLVWTVYSHLSNFSFALTGSQLAVFAVADRASASAGNARLLSLKGA